jgi:predicted transcriptional regulator
MAHKGDPDLPEDSILSKQDYLEMQRVASHEIRHAILDSLIQGGPVSATELKTGLEVRSNKLHYHLEKLVDIGLIQNRKSKTREEDGFNSYYESTALAEILLEHGIRELIAKEHLLLDAYSSESQSDSGAVTDVDTQRTEEYNSSAHTLSDDPSRKDRKMACNSQMLVCGRSQAADATLDVLAARISRKRSDRSLREYEK